MREALHVNTHVAAGDPLVCCKYPRPLELMTRFYDIPVLTGTANPVVVKELAKGRRRAVEEPRREKVDDLVSQQPEPFVTKGFQADESSLKQMHMRVLETRTTCRSFGSRSRHHLAPAYENE